MLLSIIVPVYNVEAYLEECLDSVLGQEMTDFELIAVDDHSPDGSAEILRDYAQSDPRVNVVHLEENVGLGRARNVGMERASGDYLLFLDSDDSLTPEALTTIAARIDSAERPDVVIIDHTRTYWNGTEKKNIQSALLVELGDAVFTASQHPEIFRLLQVAWNKVYRREFILGLALTFPGGYYEDTAWTHITLMAARSIATLPVVCVRYRQRRSGSILSSRSRRHFDALDQWQRLFVHLDQHPELDRWRPLVVERAIDHYIKVLVTPHRLSQTDRLEFFDLAAAHANANLDGVELATKGRAYDARRWLFLHSALRAFDVANRLEARRTAVNRSARKAVRSGKSVARSARSSWRRSAYRRHLRQPLDPDLAVFASLWNRGVAGNPAAIYHAMREYSPQMRGVWVIRPDYRSRMPAGVEWVLPDTPRYHEVVARATYFVNDVNFPDEMVKRPGQIHLQTQHGTPLKHMGLDLMQHPVAAKGMNFTRLLERADRWDYNLSSNRFSSLVWQRAFPSHFATMEAGYPRNDQLVNATAADVAAARAELGIPADKIAILFAPTHRDHDRHFTIRADLRSLAESLGEDFVLLVRAHYFYRWMPDLDQMEAEGLLRNVSRVNDVEPIMIAADALVTDYSSIMFDYANLDRPMVAYIPDWETYTDVRGVYFDLHDQPPGPLVRTQEQLAEAFTSGRYDDAESTERRASFRADFCAFDDGQAAERVARTLFLGEPQLPLIPADRRVVPPRPDHRSSSDTGSVDHEDSRDERTGQMNRTESA